MPSTIPYDPSLILGNIVQEAQLDLVIQISKAQEPADSAEATLNSFISLKHSLDMTIQEMIDLGVPIDDLTTEAQAVAKEVETSAVNFAKAKIAAEKAVQPLRAKLSGVSKSIESPIDYTKSVLKEMPISFDSLKMNAQYFSNDSNKESSSTFASKVGSYVAESISGGFMGEGGKQATQSAAAAQAQVNSQTKRHSIAGTLVISITCTHKNAQVFAPYYLNVDKAVRVWNVLYPDNMIKTDDLGALATIQKKAGTPEDKSFNILSGATYGSSFVGMVHVLNTSETESSQKMGDVAASLQETFEVGSWVEQEQGGFGVDSDMMKSAKNLLSTQNIQSHCSLITMGIIPSIKSNTVKLAVEGFSDFSPDKEMDALVKLQGATETEFNTLASGAQKARTGAQLGAMKDTQIKSVLSGVQKIDDGSNKMIDINSVMTAMDDYIQKCIGGGKSLGVPINYYLKPIYQSELVRTWLAKYFPNDFNVAGTADDSAPQKAPAQG